MPASINDKFTDVRNSARPNTATVSTLRVPSASNLACDSLVGWPTASKVHFVTYQTDTNNNVIAGTQLDCVGIVSANTITNLAVIDGTDGGNSVGDVVEMLPTAAWAQDLADGLMESLNRDGTLRDDIIDTAKIAVGAVGETELDTDSVSTAKIQDTAVTTAKLASATQANLLHSPMAHALSPNGSTSVQGPGTLTYPSVPVNVGSCMNGTTGIFTCSKAGYYYVTYTGFTDISGGNGGIYIQKNGSDAGRRIYRTVTGHYLPISITAIVECSVNDTLKIYTDFVMHTNQANLFTVMYMGTAT